MLQTQELGRKWGGSSSNFAEEGKRRVPSEKDASDCELRAEF